MIEEIEIIDIKNIFFGFSDGKTEAKKENFIETFFDYNDMYSQLENGRTLILGSKGTGKTLLIEYFKKKKIKDEGFIFIDVNLKEFLKKKKEIEKNNIIYDESSLLKWIIYIEISKKIVYLKNQNIIKNNKNIKKLEKFMYKNKFDLALDTNRIIEKIIENGIETGLKNKIFSFISKKLNKHIMHIGEYHHYIKSLEEDVNEIISNWNLTSFVYIVFDELDSVAKNNLDLLAKLVELFQEFNNKEKEFKLKMLIAMRDDIYKKLDTVISSKLREDYGLKIQWGSIGNKKSSLFDLICHKIRKSDNRYYNYSNTTIMKKIFSFEKIKTNDKYIDIYKYILGKTFLRPRDIIIFFNKLKNKASKDKKIDPYIMKSILKEYSASIFLDIKNEVTTFSLTIDEFDEIMSAFKQLSRTNFNYNDVYSFIKKHKKEYKNINLKKLKDIFKILFEVGFIGNLKTINDTGSHLVLKYKDNCEINFEEKFVIHYGMREELGLSTEKQ